MVWAMNSINIWTQIGLVGPPFHLSKRSPGRPRHRAVKYRAEALQCENCALGIRVEPGMQDVISPMEFQKCHVCKKIKMRVLAPAQGQIMKDSLSMFCLGPQAT
jgi:hypothetical protein